LVSTIDTFTPFAATAAAAVVIDKDPRQQQYEPPLPATSYYSSSLSTMASHVQHVSPLTLSYPPRSNVCKSPAPSHTATSSSSSPLGPGTRYRPSSKLAVTSFTLRAAKRGARQQTFRHKAQVATTSTAQPRRKASRAGNAGVDLRNTARCAARLPQAGGDEFSLNATTPSRPEEETREASSNPLVPKDVPVVASKLFGEEGHIEQDGCRRGVPCVVAYNPRMHKEGAAKTLASAFRDDPIFRYLLPSDRDYDRIAPSLMKLGLWAFHNEANNLIDICEVPSDGNEKDMQDTEANVAVAGVAVWEPPTFTMGQILRVVAMLLWLVFSLGVGRARKVLNILQSFHAKQDQYAKDASHLLAISTAPAFQGQGLGSKLLRYGIDRAEMKGAACYLESSSAGSRRLYERNGFKAIEEVWCDEGNGPMATIMLRE